MTSERTPQPVEDLLLELARAYAQSTQRWQALNEAQAKTLRWLGLELDQLRDEKAMAHVALEDRVRALETALVAALQERDQTQAQAQEKDGTA